MTAGDSLTNAFTYPGYLSLTLSIFCGTLQCVVLVKLIKQTRKRLPNVSTIIAYLCILFNLLYAVTVLIESLYIIITPSSSFNAVICVTGAFTPTFTSKIAEIFLYIFYLTRLHKMFEGTAFKYSKRRLSQCGTFMVLALYSTELLPAAYYVHRLLLIPKSRYKETTSLEECDSFWNYSAAIHIAHFSASLIVETVTAIIILRFVPNLLLLFPPIWFITF